jgi:sec-independent protein translocase protein TatA
MPHLGTTELFIILALVLLLFGAKKVPELARGMGATLREYKNGLREAPGEDEARPSTAAERHA